MRDNSADYRSIFLNDLPLMDMRAPVEFAKGAFPGALNLPLMTDIERIRAVTASGAPTVQLVSLAVSQMKVIGEILGVYRQVLTRGDLTDDPFPVCRVQPAGRTSRR